ncbi:hypothetical protein MN608_04569 [Microdochium nivale]|nr:hypothetical protein MN608_04569 [Microdochium nivale]
MPLWARRTECTRASSCLTGDFVHRHGARAASGVLLSLYIFTHAALVIPCAHTRDAMFQRLDDDHSIFTLFDPPSGGNDVYTKSDLMRLTYAACNPTVFTGFFLQDLIC